MTTSLTLTDVQKAFEAHRQQSGRPRIPTPLRQQAINLLNHYSRSQIVRGLGINYKMLKRWESELSPAMEELTPTAPIDFISIAPATTEAEPPSALALSPSTDVPTLMTLHLGQGLYIDVSGHQATRECLQLLHGLGYSLVPSEVMA